MRNENLAEKFTLRGYTVKIIQDTDAESPRANTQTPAEQVFLEKLADCINVHLNLESFEASTSRLPGELQMKRQKIYAYFTSETCTRLNVVKPGSFIDNRNGGEPVSRHGDYSPWTLGKRATFAVLQEPGGPTHHWRVAYAVARLMGWPTA